MSDFSITQFNQQASLQQMQMMERMRLGQGPGPGMAGPSPTGGVRDIGPDPTNMSRGQLRNQWESALGARPQQAGSNDPSQAGGADAKANGATEFKQAFGDSYIKDFSSDQARALLSQAASAISQSGVPGSAQLAQSLAQGAADPKSVNKGAIQKLQSFLQAQGCSVWEAGTDGKLGPDTFKALMKFMHKGQDGATQAPTTGTPASRNSGMERLQRAHSQIQAPAGATVWA